MYSKKCALKMKSIFLLAVPLLPFMRCDWNELTSCSCPPSASCRPSLLQAGSWHCCCLPTWVWGSGVLQQCTPVEEGQVAVAWCGPAGEGRGDRHQSHSLLESADWQHRESHLNHVHQVNFRAGQFYLYKLCTGRNTARDTPFQFLLI